MIKLFLFILIVFVTQASSAAIDVLSVKFEGGLDYRLPEVDSNGSRGSSFRGLGNSFLVEVGSRIDEFKSYNLGGLFKYEKAKVANIKNTGDTHETLTSDRFLIGGRLYALKMFIGAGIESGTSHLEGSSQSLSQESKYSDFGFYGELGGVILLGYYHIYLRPSVSYHYLKSQLVGQTGENLVSKTPEVALGLGFYF